LDSESAYIYENQATEKPVDQLWRGFFAKTALSDQLSFRAYLGRYTLPPANTDHCIPFIQDCSL
jgi:hypothetical protein